ncbi:ArnT family glycosyltransferase [Rhodanobacter ginsengisoli]|uniref:ArnT family glycosyltransferase n=1 Tax=Rhodanobacter ginsengisoli TaxID=418646 RepID=A0ABW0QQR6_9GAMM
MNPPVASASPGVESGGPSPWLAALLLLPPVFSLQPVPIDETRYLAVAWNMHLSGQWLVPWVDGAPYSDKPPLLFWLINLIWSVTGVHAWAARLLELLIALGTLPALASLGRRLGMDRAAVRATLWLWLGCAAFATYADVLLFDMLVTLCTLLAWRSTLALAGSRWTGGAMVMAVALGLGILAKGPVALLAGGAPALLAPWWLPSARAHPSGFYLRLLGVLIAAVLIALPWALAAAHAGGPRYADDIFLRQTMGRLTHSFAHARPWWWYLPMLPLMLLPWSAALGRAGATSTTCTDAPSLLHRFVVCAFLPSFVIFSLVSGKQPHYLLPLLPALALAGGTRLGTGRWRVVGWRVALIQAAIGLAVALGMGWLAVPAVNAGAIICGGLILALALSLVRYRAHPLQPGTVALGMLATLALCKFAFVLSIESRYDVRATALRVAQAQRADVPLLFAGAQDGLLTFAGRLTRPIPTARDPAKVAAWAWAHPGGWVISSDDSYGGTATPIHQQPYRGGRLAIWHASDIAAGLDRRLATRNPHPEKPEPQAVRPDR